MTDKTVRDRVARQVRALKEKTIENGCTEAEALAAAEKMLDLMNEHGLTMTDAEHAADKIGADSVQSKFKVVRPVDLTCHGIAALTGVKMWMQGQSRVFFGKEDGTAFAKWLYTMIEDAITSSCIAWYKDPATGWKQMDGQTKKTTSKDFEVGMAHRINARLHEMADLAKGAKTASGTALVPLRDKQVQVAFEALGLHMRRGGSGPRARGGSAYGQGRAAGEKVNLSRPLGNTATTRIGA